MIILVRSVLLAVPVAIRTALPVLGIVVVATVFWGFLDGLSFGMTELPGQWITAALVMLVGIRAALSVSGALPGADKTLLGLYSLMFGLVMGLGKSLIVALVLIVSLLLTSWRLDGFGGLLDLEHADAALQTAFTLQGLSTHVLLSWALTSAWSAVWLVPMAGVAHSISHGVRGRGFLAGFGTSFLPLFLICLVSSFLLFFFEIVSLLFFVLPVVVASTLASIIQFDFANLPLDTLAKGFGALLAVLFLNAWTWSAAALAWRKHEGHAPRPAAPQPVMQEAMAGTDLRALRKSRM